MAQLSCAVLRLAHSGPPCRGLGGPECVPRLVTSSCFVWMSLLHRKQSGFTKRDLFWWKALCSFASMTSEVQGNVIYIAPSNKGYKAMDMSTLVVERAEPCLGGCERTSLCLRQGCPPVAPRSNCSKTQSAWRSFPPSLSGHNPTA